MAIRKIDRQAAVAVALELLNDVGLDGLSLRRLAQRLEVQSPALYRHFTDKQDLLRAMADTMFAQDMTAFDRPPPGADWADWLVARSRAVRRIMLSYRDGGRLKEHLHDPVDHRPGLELLLQMMEEAGFTLDAALDAIFVVGNHILGTVIAEQEAQAQPPRAAAGPRVDADRFPRLAHGAAAHQRRRNFDREFDYGLRIIMSGLKADLDQRRGAIADESSRLG